MRTILSNLKSSVRRTWAYIQWNRFLSCPSKFNVETAYDTLWNFYPKERPVFTQENQVDPVVDLHLIVPVFNAEEYLEDCIRSLLHQKTVFRYHITIVNDGSTDSSAQILDQYKGDSRLTILNKENAGVSSARNKALKHILGRYVMFVDSDDILAEKATQTLLEIAMEYNADIVEGSYQLFSASGKGNCVIHGSSTKKCQSKELYGFPWGKVIKSDLLADLCFPEGYLFEDTIMSTLLHPSSTNVYTTPAIIYYYRENENGITHTSGLSPRCIDTFWIMKYCLEERVLRGQILDFSDLDKYLYALYRNWGRTYRMPKEIQESIFVLSCQLIEEYFTALLDCYDGKYLKLLQTVRKKNFDAFRILASNWWLFIK